MQQKTKEEKEELVQLYKQSGMSVRAFAQEFDINLATFRPRLWIEFTKETIGGTPKIQNCEIVQQNFIIVQLFFNTMA